MTESTATARSAPKPNALLSLIEHALNTFIRTGLWILLPVVATNGLALGAFAGHELVALLGWDVTMTAYKPVVDIARIAGTKPTWEGVSVAIVGGLAGFLTASTLYINWMLSEER